MLSEPEKRMLPFFRFEGKANRFGNDTLWRYWKMACKNLGIEGVDLYGGTKHSTITDLNTTGGYSPEEIKKGAKISSNQHFNRYFQMDVEKSRELYARAKRGEVLELRKKNL